MTGLAGYAGLAGWQWMFIIEGLPATAHGLLRVPLPRRPARRRGVADPAEKAAISTRPAGGAARRGAGAPARPRLAVVHAARPDVYLLALSWFCFICGIYMISFWLPTIIKEMGVSDPLHVGLLAAIPYGVALAATITIGLHSDRTLERRWHCAVPAFCTAVGLVSLV